jgi:sulfate adenylyltransferase subunit 1
MAAVMHQKALRFLTAGSVDDGKSTLIGRLLFDSRAILADQLDSLQARAAGAPIDLSLLTDGLEAEREQGITIDVAYRYFATPRRKFIIADAPGHEQYTRNMVTAAAGSDAALVLVDITKLDRRARPIVLLPQTRRHSLLARLLRVPSIVFVVNKLDAVEDPEMAFAAVAESLQTFASEASIEVAGIVPVSALRGDNVTTPLDSTWYHGLTLLGLLEQLPPTRELVDAPFGLPVQYVAKRAPGAGAPARVLWGRIAQGEVAVGDAVQVFPGGARAAVIEVRGAGRRASSATAGQSAGVVLDRQLDVSRGDWLARPGALQPVDRFTATIAWLDVEPARLGQKYLVRHGNRWVSARIAAINHRLNIETLEEEGADTLHVNDIGDVVVELQAPLPLAPFDDNRVAGSLIVVDHASHRTSGALLVRGG